MAFDTTNLNKKITEFNKIKKPFFILDYDNITKRNLILNYARLFAFFLENETQYKKELDCPELFRVYHSSSKKHGYHIKVRKQNNLIENLYYRAFFRDDEFRILGDLKRLNYENLIYDVAFKYKVTFEKEIKKKEFVLIDMLKFVGITRKTFYKLILRIKQKKHKNINLILNNITENFDIEIFENEIKKLKEKIAKIKKGNKLQNILKQS